MLAESLHATADTGNELLLPVGMKRSSRPPDEFDPYGHGKALNFYSLLVAKTETKGYARAFRRAADSLPRYRSGSAASCPALRRCAPVARFPQWSGRPSLMAGSCQWHSRSYPKYLSPPGALLPSSPVYPQDNAQRSCSPWPPIHGRRIRWRVNACSCSR